MSQRAKSNSRRANKPAWALAVGTVVCLAFAITNVVMFAVDGHWENLAAAIWCFVGAAYTAGCCGKIVGWEGWWL